MFPRSYRLDVQLFSASSTRARPLSVFWFLQSTRRTLLTLNLPAFMLLLLSLRPVAAQQKYLPNTNVFPPHPHTHTQTPSLYIALDSSSRSPVKTERRGWSIIFYAKEEITVSVKENKGGVKAVNTGVTSSEDFDFISLCKDKAVDCSSTAPPNANSQIQPAAALKPAFVLSCERVTSVTPTAPSARQMLTKVCDTIRTRVQTLNYWRCCRVYEAFKSAVLHV